MNDFSNRLKALMDHKNLQIKELADVLGVQRSGISHILNGRNKPSVPFIVRLSEVFPEVNMTWLLHGKGDMVTSVSHVGTSESNQSKTALDNGSEADTSVTTQDAEKENRAVQYSGIRYPANNKKSLQRIVLFYSDGSFETFLPDQE